MKLTHWQYRQVTQQDSQTIGLFCHLVRVQDGEACTNCGYDSRRDTPIKFVVQEVDEMRGHISERAIDLAGFKADRAARESARLLDAKLAKLDADAKLIKYSSDNAWLIAELTAYGAQFDATGSPSNFLASMVQTLQMSAASDLGRKPQAIIADILCKGYRGKARDARYNQVYDAFETK